MTTDRVARPGKRFGRLVALAYGPQTGKNLKMQCRCDCGKQLTVFATALQSGATRSCGCLRSELMKERNSLTKAMRGQETRP